MMPAWGIALLTALFLAALLVVRRGLRIDASQPKPEFEDEDLP